MKLSHVPREDSHPHRDLHHERWSWLRLIPVIVALTNGVALSDDGSSTLDSGLLGYWKFDGDCKDHSGKANHGRGHGVDFSTVGRDGRPQTAARFDGLDDCVEVPHSASLRFGDRPFSVAAWIHLERDLDDVVGDIVSKFDSRSRRGLNLYVKGSSPTYSSHGDARNVHFGIDNGVDGSWEDCGKLWPSNTYVSSLVVYKGELYGGVADAADPQDACHVFRYAGGTQWLDCGRVGPNLRTRSVYSMIVHQGDLYAGTGQYDWQTVNLENCDPARVYRYTGGKQWVDCGQPGANYRILSMASYQGGLYVGTDVTGGAPRGPSTGKVYRHLGGAAWADCGRLGEQQHVFALIVHDGDLWGGTAGQVYRYQGGTEWAYVGTPCDNTQIHSLEVYRGKLYAGTWPDGKVCRYDGGTQWTDCGQLGVATKNYQINEVNALTVYNGKLYGGAIPRAEVYRYEGFQSWDLLRQLVTNPAYAPDDISSWNRTPCLTVFDGELYAGTGTCRGNADEHALDEVGRVYRMHAGRSLTYNHDLGAGWRHIVAVRGSNLKLYIDGEEQATSASFSYSQVYDIENSEPLMIGFGAVDYFSGSIDELRIYDRALTAAEAKHLYR